MRITLNTNNNTYKYKFNKNFKTNPNFSNSIDSFEKTNLNFQGMRCSESSFKIKSLEYLHCPACGLLMLSKSQVKSFISDVANKKGQELADALAKYEDESVFVKNEKKNKRKTIYRPQKQEVVNVIKKLAVEHPDLNLAQLVQLKAKEHLASLIDHQLIIVDKLEKYINENLSDQELEKATNTIAEFKEQIHGTGSERFRRKNFISALNDITVDPTKQEKITEIISELPTSDTSVDSFFVKYSQDGRTSKEIASKFVAQSIPTAEHLIPKARGGKDNTANYICDCADCNSSRGDMPFDEWQEIKPQLKENLQQYLEDVQEAINLGLLHSDYDTYIEEIVAEILKLSKGKIQLIPPEINNDEQYKAVMQKRKADVEKVEKEIAQLYVRRKSLKKEIAQLEEHPNFRSIVQYQILQNQIKELSEKEILTDRELARVREQKRRITEQLDAAADLKESIKTNPFAYSERELEQISSETNTEELEEQLKELKAKEEELLSKKAELNRQISSLSEKRLAIAQLGLPMENLKASINKQKEIINAIEILTARISLLESSIQDETLLLQRLRDIDFETNEYQTINQIIAEKQEQEFQDTSKYEEYLHLTTLSEKTMDMSDTKDSHIREIMLIAQDSIRERACDLFEEDEVRFFANQDSLKEIETEKTIILERLAEISRVREGIRKVEEQISNLTNGKTIEEIKLEYELLIKQQETIDKICNISELRNQLKAIEDTIAYNKGILKQLQAYRILSNETFRNLLNLIYLYENTI